MPRPDSLLNKLTVVAASVAAIVAIFSYLDSRDAKEEATRATEAQRAFEAEVEERQSVPVLAPDVEPELHGKAVTVPTALGTVKKPRAERLYVSPDLGKPGKSRPKPQIIMPMRNVGDGVAIINVSVKFQHSCNKAPPPKDPLVLARGQTRYLGYYNVPPRESRQLAFAPLKDDRSAHAPYLKARSATRLHLMVIYTDLLGRKLRWTCVDYTRPSSGASWSVKYPYYGDVDRRSTRTSG